jgi:hypothetical protein
MYGNRQSGETKGVIYRPEAGAMSNNGLFFLDATGWLASPESAPYPNERHAIEAARRALRRHATGKLETQLLFPDRLRDDKSHGSNNPCAQNRCRLAT